MWRALVWVTLGLLSACANDGHEAHPFTCSEQVGCQVGFSCDLATNICVPASVSDSGSASDAAGRFDGSSLQDATLQDAEPPPADAQLADQDGQLPDAERPAVDALIIDAGVSASDAQTAQDAQTNSEDASPRPVDASPEPVDASPGPIDAAPQPIDAAPVPVDAAPAVIDAAPPPEDAAPPVNDAGAAPERCDPPCRPGTLCREGVCVDGVTGVASIDQILLADEARYNRDVLRSQNPDLSWRPSRIYRWADFLQAVSSMYSPGIADMRLWMGDEGIADERRASYALVNLAAFLAQSMKETIQYDACDENNWDNTNGYQISNACGQLGQVYENYDCEMACPRAPNMVQSAATNAVWFGAPGPFFCAPDAVLREAGLLTPEGRTGRWDHAQDCWPYPATEPNFTPADQPVYTRPACEVYVGQRGGRWVWDGSGGSVEGCCWWGRGVIQTTGRCNFGVLNHYLGRTHLDAAEFPAPAQALYPDVNFCENPGVICSSQEHPELKWIAGLFYWMSSVQNYERDGWAYLDALREFVDNDLQGNAFIDAVSGIVNRGCHNPPCAAGPVDGVDDRRQNFDRVLRAMGLR